MVVSQFSMSLENPEAAYIAGQNVTGKLVLVVAIDSESFESILLECSGFTKVNFTQAKNEKQMTTKGASVWIPKTKRCLASKRHFQVSLPLLTGSEGNQSKFDVGQHTFPFSFNLPNSIPSSFEGNDGHIRYVLSGQLKRHVNSKKEEEEHHVSMNIRLNKLVDLNLDPVAKMPDCGMMSMNFSYWCGFRKGPVTAKAWIYQSGYAPGQILHFNAVVENLSKKKMDGSTVRLIQKIVYCAQGEKKEAFRVIRNSSHGAFGSSDVWKDVPFLIPHVAPTDEHLSDHLKISYRIEFTVLPGSCSDSEKLKLKRCKFMIPLDIIIGSIPLKDSESAMIPFGDGAPPKYEDVFSAESCVMGDGDDAASPSNATRARTEADVDHATLDG